MFSFVVFWIWIKQIISVTNGSTSGLCYSPCVTISKMIQKRRSFWRQWRYGMHLQVHVWLFIYLVIQIIYLVVPISLLSSIPSTHLPIYLHRSFCACVSLILWRPWVKCCFFWYCSKSCINLLYWFGAGLQGDKIAALSAYCSDQGALIRSHRMQNVLPRVSFAAGPKSLLL